MTKELRDEISRNFLTFEQTWPSELTDAQARLAPAQRHFEQSYVNICTIQAWRTAVVLPHMPEGASAFFFEAQNDLLISHCLARCGSFRQALKALRGAIENVYFSLFYKDHPVEMQKWEDGRHKPGFTELTSYFEGHPSNFGHQLPLQCIGALKDEYATLSKAVHGSAKAFRMTRDLQDVRLWSADVPSVGKWATREKATIASLNILLCYLFSDHLKGTTNRALRETIGLVFSASQKRKIKEDLGINIP